MQFLILWQSTDVESTAPKFCESGFGFGPDVKVINSVHVVGKPEGAIIVETNKPEAIQTAAAAWGSSIECEVAAVIDDETAKAALANI